MPSRSVAATARGNHAPARRDPLSGVSLWPKALLLSCTVLLAGCAGEIAAGPRSAEPGSATQGVPFGRTSADGVTPVPTLAESVPPQPPRARWPVTIAAVGDIMLDRSVAEAITPEHPEGPFAHVLDVLQSADLTVGNLESAVSDLGQARQKSYTFRAPPLAAAGLAAAGFDLVSIANNHSLDFGPEALVDTVEQLRAASVEVVGGGRDNEEAYRYRVLTAHGVRVAFLGLAEVPNDNGYDRSVWIAAPGKPGIAWVDEERMAATVREAAQAAEVVVVMLHFGIEGASEPLERQRQLSRSAIDAGANLVVGSHPHVLQKLEDYGGGLIAYSLGNFVFDGFEGDANKSGILLVSFAADGSPSWRMEPVSIGWDGLPRLRE